MDKVIQAYNFVLGRFIKVRLNQRVHGNLQLYQLMCKLDTNQQKWYDKVQWPQDLLGYSNLCPGGNAASFVHNSSLLRDAYDSTYSHNDWVHYRICSDLGNIHARNTY